MPSKLLNLNSISVALTLGLGYLNPTLNNSAQICYRETSCITLWIEIYPVDNVIYLLNNSRARVPTDKSLLTEHLT